MTSDSRITTYIAKAPPFARPILSHLRKLVHQAVPDVEEAIKWGHPHFVHEGMLCHMAAFKQHVAFGFWKARLLLGPDQTEDRHAMGQFGRITSPKDLPTDRELVALIKRAAALNHEGIKRPRTTVI